jgi:16S rRNA (cytosine967-C5)-methyltransferase
MPPAALIERATELLRAVLKFDAPADGIVSAHFRKHRLLGPRERHALAETVYAVLRQRLRLQQLAQSGIGPLERRLVIAGWQGDERALQVALDPREREWLAAARAIDPASLPDNLRHNLPPWLAEALQRELGDAEFRTLAESLQTPAPLDLRVNVWRAKREDVRLALQHEGIAAEATPYSPWGLRIAGRPAVNRLQPFKDGAFEVQDEGSQLLALLVDPRRGEMVADFCAGAGGKTLALGAMMRSTGRLYALDTSGHRLDALKPRLARSGLSNVHPVQIAHERDERVKRLAGKIDRVLVDAPCSGLGTLRRNPDLKWRQNPETIAALRRQQDAILDSAARLVKTGGWLVYATCSLLRLENEEVAATFERSQPDFRPVDAGEVLHRHVGDVSALVVDGRLRLWPHRHATDGFFAAIWRRRA